MVSNVKASSHNPSHFAHPRKSVSPICSGSRSRRQRGQSPDVSSKPTSIGAAIAPQWPQNLVPTNINPKQDGQPTVLSLVLQNSHCVRSLWTPAPQFGQFRASTVIYSVLRISQVSVVSFVLPERAFLSRSRTASPPEPPASLTPRLPESPLFSLRE